MVNNHRHSACLDFFDLQPGMLARSRVAQIGVPERQRLLKGGFEL